jgi:hypothetical protein
MDIAHEQGFKCLVFAAWKDALMTARKFRPDTRTLSILPLPGCTVMRYSTASNHDPSTRHIPIQVISVVDDPKRVLKLGAYSHIPNQ